MSSSLKSICLSLFLFTLLIRILTALSLQHAGYFDAFYYYHLALNMADGEGITSSIIWNYLDHPTTLPRPGNQYWMPMTNLLAWLGITIFRPLLGAWRAAQVPFILLSALIPPLAAWISWREWQRPEWAWQAGLLTIFSSFYFSHWVVPDNFTPFALTVALALLAIWQGLNKPNALWWVLAGVGAALSHLSRVDGALLVPLIALFLMRRYLGGKQKEFALFLRHSSSAAFGYLLFMLPWWLRNWLTVGTPFPGGGIQTLWLRRYDDIFSYQPELSFATYLEWGLGAILASKWQALLHSILLMLGLTLIFMMPFILIMLRDAMRSRLFRPFLLYLAMILTVMPLIFTFPTTRGSLLHTSAAFIPWLMTLVPPGIERVVRWVAERRSSWNVEQATYILGYGFIGVAMIVTLYTYVGAVWLPAQSNAVVPSWNDRTLPYEEVERWLASEGGASLDERIFVLDPPAYYITTKRPALVIPNDGPEVLAEAAHEWNCYWFLLDANNKQHYEEMYTEQTSIAGWEHVATFTDGLERDVYLFHLDN